MIARPSLTPTLIEEPIVNIMFSRMFKSRNKWFIVSISKNDAKSHLLSSRHLHVQFLEILELLKLSLLTWLVPFCAVPHVRVQVSLVLVVHAQVSFVHAPCALPPAFHALTAPARFCNHDKNINDTRLLW